jgi:ribosome biogenesis GTPase / thiamine phosphate phosphatase
MTGIIVKIVGSDCFVRCDDGRLVVCKVRGNFRIKGIKSTNPVAVGDRVDFDEVGLITHLHDRKNYIVRKPTNLSKQLHIIAANIDQAVLVVTLRKPETSTIFIDRFLATAEAYGVPTILVFNKIDLLDEKDRAALDDLCRVYEKIGYRCVRMVAETGENLQELQSLLLGKTTLLSGNSGVGKSTLINRLLPNAEAKTAAISEAHLTGMHTTTFSEMYEVAPGTFVIDTPGLKGFGMVNMKADEVGHFFPEIFEASHRCRYNNCSHTHEPGCAVIEAVEQGEIAMSRFVSYNSILEDFDEEKYR